MTRRASSSGSYFARMLTPPSDGARMRVPGAVAARAGVPGSITPSPLPLSPTIARGMRSASADPSAPDLTSPGLAGPASSFARPAATISRDLGLASSGVAPSSGGRLPSSASTFAPSRTHGQPPAGSDRVGAEPHASAAAHGTVTPPSVAGPRVDASRSTALRPPASTSSLPPGSLRPPSADARFSWPASSDRLTPTGRGSRASDRDEEGSAADAIASPRAAVRPRHSHVTEAAARFTLSAIDAGASDQRPRARVHQSASPLADSVAPPPSETPHQAPSLPLLSPSSRVARGVELIEAPRAAPSSAAGRDGGTRVEIGHIEVRLTPPPRPPSAAPARPSGSLVRALAPVFGLRQS